MENGIKKECIDSLQAVRAIAFLGVFFCHAVRSFLEDGILYDFFDKSLGRWGVSVFFILSGFVISYSYWDRQPPKSLKEAALFSIKKVLRLYPLHLLMLLVGAVYLLLQREAVFEVLCKLAITIPLIQTWLPRDYQGVNSVAWYLSVCVFLYFCFPYLLNCIKKDRGKSAPKFAIVCIFLVSGK